MATRVLLVFLMFGVAMATMRETEERVGDGVKEFKRKVLWDIAKRKLKEISEEAQTRRRVPVSQDIMINGHEELVDQNMCKECDYHTDCGGTNGLTCGWTKRCEGGVQFFTCSCAGAGCQVDYIWNV